MVSTKREFSVTQNLTNVVMNRSAHKWVTQPGYLLIGKMRDVMRKVVVSPGVNVSWDTVTTEIVENPEYGTQNSSNVLNHGRCQHVGLQPQQQSQPQRATPAQSINCVKRMDIGRKKIVDLHFVSAGMDGDG